MKCPSCAQSLAAPAPRCPHCRLSLARLDAKFGLVPAHSRFLTDRSGRLPLEQMQELRAALRLFHTKFPQSLFSMLITDLPRGTSVTEYAFWLANRARFSAVERTQGENCNLLLVVDLAGKCAALNVGYGLEPYVSEQDLQSIIDDFAGTLREGELTAGLAAAIESATRRLRESSLAAKRQPTPA